MKKLIVASSSSVHGSGYLEYLLPTLEEFFIGVNSILFIPYARPSGISYTTYTKKASEAFKKIGKTVKGIHEFDNPVIAVKNAEAIFVGGGNTFELVNQLYENKIMFELKNVVERGTPYLGTSAGSNICGVNMKNTNDMPIVYPKSFDTMNLIPFNINAHYIEPDPKSTHMGETRETRIKEFHVYNDTSVLGLKEGSWLEVIDNEIQLKGNYEAVLFQKNQNIKSINKDSVINMV